MCSAQGKVVPATQVDHITPIVEGGDWFDADNLQSLCLVCHSQKTRGDEGKAVRMGASVDGVPLDPKHPWNAQG